MNRVQKEAFLEGFSKKIASSQAFALFSFSKLNVEKMTAFRLGLRKKNVYVKVIKNTLAKRIFDQSNFKTLGESLTGPTLIAYSDKDPVVTTKAIWEWVEKEGMGLKAKSGMALGRVMTGAELKTLSKLPGRNELLVSFLWGLKSHPTRFLYALQDSPRKLGYAVAALREKKTKET